jgi:hypothetical protein
VRTARARQAAGCGPLRALLAGVLLSLGTAAGAVAGDTDLMAEWGEDGAKRKQLRESMVALQKNLEVINRNLASAVEVVEATAARVPESGVLEKLARIEAAVGEYRERLSARWQREHAARERERTQRERETEERLRRMR